MYEYCGWLHNGIKSFGKRMSEDIMIQDRFILRYVLRYVLRYDLF